MMFSEKPANSISILLEVLGSSEILTHFYQTTWRHMAAESKLHSHHREIYTYMENSIWCMVRVLTVSKF
jgi:hypothetical protein